MFLRAPTTRQNANHSLEGASQSPGKAPWSCSTWQKWFAAMCWMITGLGYPQLVKSYPSLARSQMLKLNQLYKWIYIESINIIYLKNINDANPQPCWHLKAWAYCQSTLLTTTWRRYSPWCAQRAPNLGEDKCNTFWTVTGWALNEVYFTLNQVSMVPHKKERERESRNKHPHSIPPANLRQDTPESSGQDTASAHQTPR